MKTIKKSLWAMTCLMCAALLLSTIFVACGSSEDSVDEPNKPKPEVPVADGDWQVVPATGGTIEKGDITITFPSGTFSKDTKVAITDVRKGETCGEYEVSKFYQITMPVKIDKSFTVSIKCTEQASDIHFAAKTSGYRKSSCDYAPQIVGLDGTYVNGMYKLTLPATKRSEDDGNSYLTLGLSHDPTLSSNSKSRGLVPASLIEGKVANIEWWYTIGSALWHGPSLNTPSAVIGSAQWIAGVPSLRQKLDNYIPEAIKKIHNLGFRVLTERQIPFVFLYDGSGDQYASFHQNPFYDEWSTIDLNMAKLNPIASDTTTIKQTVIHELLHYYQADYGPSSTLTNTDEATMLSEAGSVWAEQFMDDGKLNNAFVLKYLPWYLASFYDVEAAWARDTSEKTTSKRYAAHGYAMSTLFYYFTNPLSKKNGLALDNTKILEFYQLWDKHPGQGFAPILQWLTNHKNNFLKSSEYEDYVMCVLSGELFPYKTEPLSNMINIQNLFSNNSVHYEESISSDGKKENSFSCFSFGCYFGNYSFADYQNEKGEKSLKGKEIVIKQLKPKVTTYVIASEKNRKKMVKQLPGKIMEGDSIVISGDELEQMFDGAGITSLYTVTINAADLTRNGQVSFEIRNSHYAYVKPTELTFPAEGGTQTVTVTAKGYKKYNHEIDNEYKSWLSGKNNSAGKLDITAQPNTTGKERVGYVKPYVLIDENSTERVYLTPVKVTQAANEKQGDDTQSEFKIVSGAIHMYYAVAWRHDMSFKAGDEFSTITPKGKGANVKYVQSGRDTGANATWKITVTFDVDDLSLVNAQKAKLSNFKYVYERIQGEYNYYGNHVDYGREDATMESKVSKSQNANGIWYFEAGDLTYHQESMLHYDVWHKDAYSKAEEHTVTTETNTVTNGSYVTISLNVEKKK